MAEPSNSNKAISTQEGIAPDCCIFAIAALKSSLRGKLIQPAALRPRGVHGAQMDAEHAPRRARWRDLEEGVAREPRMVPLGACDGHANDQ